MGLNSELKLLRQQIVEAPTAKNIGERYLLLINETKREFTETRNASECLARIGTIRDAMAEAVLPLVEAELVRDGFGPIPVDYCWVAVGSQGRGEETFVTDQDFLLVFEVPGSQKNEVPGEDVRFYIDEFCRRAVDMFHKVGISRCKGGIVPSNAKWRGSVDMWKERIDRKCQAFERSLVDFFVLADARPVKGKRRLIDDVMDYFYLRLRQDNRITKEMTSLAVSIPTVGFLGRIRTDSKGKHKGKANLKLIGRTPLILCLQCLSLHAGIKEVSFGDRISRLQEAGLLSDQSGRDIEEALMLFLHHRISNEVKEKQRDELNYVDPDELSKTELSAVRKAISNVHSFQTTTRKVLVPRQLPTS